LTEGFRGPDLKLRRAEHHIADVNALLKDFAMDPQSYTAVADFDLSPGSICWVARGKEVLPHDEFAPVIGDAIHNMRDALDLAVSVIMRNAGKSDKNVHFPIRGSLVEFTLALEEQKPPKFPQELTDVLENGIQPMAPL
jgi:hypothetical protein